MSVYDASRVIFFFLGEDFVFINTCKLRIIASELYDMNIVASSQLCAII